jgi:hypothetical protein
VATGRGRGGVHGWRDWLRRATHHSADDDRQLVQAAEQSRREREGEDEHGESSGSSVSSGSTGTRAQASLDQVLRRAAEARATRRDRER